MKQIVGANRRETKIEIVLPVDSTGEYAYDDEGKAIRGRIPVTFTVPRFDCISRDEFKALNKELALIDKAKDEDGKPLSAQERGIKTVLAMVRPFVTEETLAVLENLYLFELEQIAECIQEGSQISVGELVASSNS
jgi:hypothetical protein